MGTVVVPAKKGDTYVHVLMDREDVDLLGKRRLSVASHGYPQVTPYGSGRVVPLHRWILGLTAGDGLIGDHISGEKLDNRRINLRVVDPSGSSQNVAGRGASQFRGVYPSRFGSWYARVKFKNVTYPLGTFATETDAARAADIKRRELMPSYVMRAEDLALLYPNGGEPTMPVRLVRRRDPSVVCIAYQAALSSGKTVHDVALDLGITVGGVRAALHRAKLRSAA